MSRFLIINPNSYLGVALVKRLLDLGDSVYTISEVKEGYTESLKLGIESFLLKSLKPDYIREYLKKIEPDFVVYSEDVFEYRMEPEEYIKRLKTFVESMYNFDIKMFLYISSSLVYGDQGTRVVTEVTPPEPKDAYAFTKYEGEKFLDKTFIEKDFPSVIIRHPMVYELDSPYPILQYFMKKEPVVPSQENYISLINLNDLTEAILFILKKGYKGETYIVCDDRPLKLYDFFETIKKYLGMKSSLIVSKFRYRIVKRYFLLKERISRRKSYKLLFDHIELSQRLSNLKIRRLGWDPTFKHFEDWMKRNYPLR
ncbi:MAG: NAD-dependent epimerase/dehydratase family protein [Candidatus Asgardarchaeia archaeon]